MQGTKQEMNDRLYEAQNAPPRTSSRDWRVLTILFFVALVARVAMLFIDGINTPLVADARETLMPAIRLARGEGYLMVPQQSLDGIARPTAYRMPGSAVLLAIGVCLFGPSSVVARIVGLVVASFSAPLMYLLARHATSPAAAKLAGIACALYPSWVAFSIRPVTDTFFFPTLLLALLLTVRAFSSTTPFPWIAVGLGWGASTLIRPHGLVMAFAILPYVVYQAGWRYGAMLLLGISATLAPWFIRNEIVLGHPILLCTEGGETLLGANNPHVMSDPKVRGFWISPLTVPEYSDRLKQVHDEYERNAIQSSLAIDYLGSHPGDGLVLAAYKVIRWLSPVTGSTGLVRILVLLSYGPLLVLVVFGLAFRVFRPSVCLHLVMICSVCLVGITAVYWGNMLRGRLPLELLWVPWAGSSAWSVATRAVRFQGTRTRP